MIEVDEASRIVERGSHAELVAHNGVYADLFRHWSANTKAS